MSRAAPAKRSPLTASPAALQARLLGWYDKHRRVMPWRARKGQRPDPYHVWLSEIMLQQTTVVTVGPYFEKFVRLWPTVQDLAAATQDAVLAAWAGLGYYARARNLHRCAQVVAVEYGGRFPQTVDELLALPGIGPYTAAAVASIAFDRPAVAVDGNVERVTSRFFAIAEPLPKSKDAIRQGAAKLAEGVTRPGDFTQAFMELGATICTPRKPKCGICPWAANCVANKKGIQEELPRKAAKVARPVRYGKVFVIRDDKGRILIHRRQEKGLYEGMYQLPTTDWIERPEEVSGLAPPFTKKVRLTDSGVTVRHTFTHFDLVLEIWTGACEGKAGLPGECRAARAEFQDYALPTLMQKAIRLASGEAATRKKVEKNPRRA